MIMANVYIVLCARRCCKHLAYIYLLISSSPQSYEIDAIFIPFAEGDTEAQNL